MSKFIEKGVVYKITETTAKNLENGYQFFTRTLVLLCARFDSYTGEKVSENYNVFEFRGKDRCDSLDVLYEGDLISVTFILSGRKYKKANTEEEAFFNSLIGLDFKIEKRATETEDAMVEREAVTPPEKDGVMPF